MEEAWKRKRKRKREAEAEAEAVEGRLEEAEAEAKEKLTAVPSLLDSNTETLTFKAKSDKTHSDISMERREK